MLEFFAQASGGREGSFVQTLVMIGIAVVFFYFILYRPERKRRKALEQQRGSMKTGDKVTAMGILGTIDQIKEDSVILKMFDGSKIEVLKMAVSEVRSSEPKVEVEAGKSK